MILKLSVSDLGTFWELLSQCEVRASNFCQEFNPDMCSFSLIFFCCLSVVLKLESLA
jgi:hypothetical protein